MFKSIVKFVVFLIIANLTTWYGVAQTTVDLENTTFSTCGNALPTAIISLGTLTFSETTATDFSINNNTFFIQAPSNFEISTTTATSMGSDISAISVTQVSGNPSRLQVQINVTATATIDVFSIENVQIQLISGATATDGQLVYIEGAANALNGLANNAILETITFTPNSGGTGVDQSVCAIADVQNITVIDDNVTQSRTYAWDVLDNGVWTAIPSSNTEALTVDTATFPNGISTYRRATSFSLYGETCTLYSSSAVITVNEIYPGSITEGTNQNICANETPEVLNSTSDVAVTPSGGVATYQWYENSTGTWTAITGANDSFYQPGALSETTSFRRRITNSYGSFSCFEETNPVSIIVNAVVAGGTTTDQNICALADIQLLTVNNGENTGTYQWQKNISGTWEDIAGATQGTYDASGNLTPGISMFRRITRLSGVSCEGISTVSTITYTDFTVGSISGAQTICYNEVPTSLTSTSEASGSGTISYQWEIFDGTDWNAIAGATLVSYQPAALQESTSYRRRDRIELNGFSCTDVTNEIRIEVLDDINGGVAVADQTLCVGETPTAITITGGTAANQNISYQWQSRTSGSFANMVGETDPSLTIPSSPANTTEYRRQTLVSNNGEVCFENSTVSTIFINKITPGVIGNDQDICRGAVPNTLVSISNTIAEGSVTYNWESSSDNGTTWQAIGGATGTTHNPGSFTNNMQFRRLDISTLNGKVCSAYTNTIRINVAGEIEGGTGSSEQTICEDALPTTLTVTGATPAGTGVNFQWYASPDAVTYSIITGETGEELDVSSPITETTYYRRSVTVTSNGNTCTAFSTPTKVTLLALDAGTISQTQTVCDTGTVNTITSTEDAVSNGTITYTWQDSDDGNTWVDIASTDQATYTPALPTETEKYYRRKATAVLNGLQCVVFTDGVIVYANRFVMGNTHRVTFSGGETGSIDVCTNSVLGALRGNFMLTATGDLTYQWQVSNDNITFSDIGGATSPTYNPPMITADIFYRRITTSTLNGISCELISNVLEIRNGGLATPGEINTTNPNDTPGLGEEVICRGTIPSPIVETTAATGPNLTYEWFANGQLIAGETGINYTPTNAITATTNYVRTTYSTQPNGAVCEVSTEEERVLVPQADNIGSDQIICTNSLPETLGDSSLVEGLPYLNFQWYRSTDGVTFNSILGATSVTYTPNTPFTADAYFYRAYTVIIAGTSCGPEIQSNTVKITVNNVDGGTISEDQKICYGEDPAVINSTAAGTARGILSYQWYSSLDNSNWVIINQANNSTFDPEPKTVTTYYRRATVSSSSVIDPSIPNVDCTAFSNTIVIEVAEEIRPGILEENQTLCVGDTPATLTVTNGSTYSDQTIAWYSSLDGIIFTDIGVNTASYTPPILSQTTHYKRRITRTSLGTLTCFEETNTVTLMVNDINPGSIGENQEVCEGEQPDVLTEITGATATGSINYQWLSSTDNQTYTEVSGAIGANFLPPTTLATSTYFKRRSIVILNGQSCFADTDPVLVTIIPTLFIDNDAIIANDITDASCNGSSDGSISITNLRITGGNSAQAQENTITLFGSPEVGTTYSIIINSKVYEHEVQLNGSSQTQTHEEIIQALVQNINNATGSNLSDVIASLDNERLILTAKVAGTGFTAYASTDSTTNAGASSVITKENKAPNSYLWTKTDDTSFSATTLNISGVTAGVYFLTITNDMCQVTSEPFVVSEPEELTLAIGDTCNAALTAASMGGVPPYTFTISRPDGTQQTSTSSSANITYTGLTGGATYTITVQDASCAIPVSESVTLPFGLQFDAASVLVNNVSCYDQNDGSISLNNGATTITGGSAPYNFNWTGPNNASYNTDNISNLSPGVYVLQVSDQLGCTATYTANVASKTALQINNVQVVNQRLQCAGDTNAEIGVQISADPSSMLQIEWLKNGTNFINNNTNIGNLGAGTYEVIVTDTNSNPDAPCRVSRSFEIIEPEPFLAVNISGSTSNCYDEDASRSFSFRVSGGTPPYSYSVDNATPILFTDTQTTITGLSNDSHSIDVTDSNGCALQQFTMIRSEPITYTGTRSFTMEACEDTYAFSLDSNLFTGATPFAGGNDYLYEWRGPNNFVTQDITSFEAEVGTYFLTVIDANNCESSEIEFSFSPAYAPIAVENIIQPVSCGSDNDGSIQINISGGVRPYTISWEIETPGNEANPNPVFTPLPLNTTRLNNLETGRIRLTVTSDIAGCTQENEANYYQEVYTIPKAESLRLVDGPYLDENLCIGNPGNITVTIFNAQQGDLSFYYQNNLVSAIETGEDTYRVQIPDPVETAILNVVNDQGCGFTMPLETRVATPSFSYTSEDLEATGLLLIKKDIRFTNTTVDAHSQAIWDFGDGSAPLTVNPEVDGTVTQHAYNFSGEYEVTLSTVNAQGCSKQMVQNIQVGDTYKIVFPDAFSPNADGINDYFQGKFAGISKFEFQIYDMWGALVYSTKHDHDSAPTNWGWNGTYSNRKPYQQFSFRYVFKGYTGENIEIIKTGEATIIR